MEGIEEDYFVTAEVSDRLQLWAENAIDVEKWTLILSGVVVPWNTLWRPKQH